MRFFKGLCYVCPGVLLEIVFLCFHIWGIQICVLSGQPLSPPLVCYNYNTTGLELEKESLEGNSAVSPNFFSALNIWEECTSGQAVVRKMNLQQWFCCKGEPKVEHTKDKASEIKVTQEATGIWELEWLHLGDTWDITIYAQLLQGLKKDSTKPLAFEKDSQPHTQTWSCSLIPFHLSSDLPGCPPWHTSHAWPCPPTLLPEGHQGHGLWTLSCVVANALSLQLISNH